MNTPISSRIQMDMQYDMAKCQYVGTAFDPTTGEVYVKLVQDTDYWLRQNLSDAVSLFMEGWPGCQDQTLNTEPKYRKTITSSCGLLKVTESL